MVIGPVLLAMVERGRILTEKEKSDYLMERRLANHAGSFITRDPSDGLFVLDYLVAARTIMQDQTAYETVVGKAWNFLAAQEEQWTKRLRLDIAEKYRAAQRYFFARGIRERPPTSTSQEGKN
jgi:hypothetical protein